MPVILAALVIGGAAAPLLLWEKGAWVALASAPVGGSILAGLAAIVRVAVRSRRWRSAPAIRVVSPPLRDDARTGLR